MRKFFLYFGFTVVFVILYCTVVKADPQYNIDLDLYNDDTKAVQIFNNFGNDVYLTDDDVYLMAQIVFAESQGEPYEGKLAVASVILNRVNSPGFPKTIKGVITQKDAFSCVKNGKIDIIPDEHSYSAVLDALKGKDPTDKAVFFYNPKTSTSSWMKNINKEKVKNIGNHVFFTAKQKN